MKTASVLREAVLAVPEGYHTVTTCLVIKGAGKAIEFYKKALGAKLLSRMDTPDGKAVAHAILQIGDSRIFLSDEFPGMGARSPESLGGATSSIYLYVEDVDKAFRKAIGAGGKLIHPVNDAFWGDRTGTFADPFGYQWDLATHVEEVSPAEMTKRGEAFFKEMATKGGSSG
ncbi:MAG TPA: VOC family protein [Candidatus Deferrimicrobiaceae bacterium]|jgi:PhnB protein